MNASARRQHFFGTIRFVLRGGAAACALASIDLLHAIGLAGGFTRLANASRVTVKRTIDGRAAVHVLDAKRMAADSSTEPFVVLPGDTITVAERLF